MTKNALIMVLLAVLSILPASKAAAANIAGVPVLMYHKVGNIPANPAVISLENFDRHMSYLARNAYSPLTMDGLYNYLHGKKSKLPVKPVVITFDDGYRDIYEDVLPVLKKYHLKATLFLIASKVNKVFTTRELQEMQRQGLEIYSHTYSHADLATLDEKRQEKEIASAKEVLTRLTGKKQVYFAYPLGHYNPTTLRILKKHGYKMAFTNQKGWAGQADDPLLLKRIYLGNMIPFSAFKERLNNPKYKLAN